MAPAVASAGKATTSDADGIAERPKTRREIELEQTQKLMDKAEQLLADVDEAFIFKEREPREYPRFDRSELKIGPVLGVGGFGVVCEIKDIELSFPSEVQIIASEREGNDGNSERLSDNSDGIALMEGPESAGIVESSDAAEPMHDSDLNYEVPNDSSAVDGVQVSAEGQQPRHSDDTQQTTASNTTIIIGEENDPLNSVRYAVGPGNMGNDTTHQSQDNIHYDVQNARQHMAQHVRRNGDARYAVKRLHRDLSDLERTRGMIDMAIEAKFLSAVWHPNIVKMRGIASGPSLSTEFFIVMDRLYGTLADKIQEWRNSQSKLKGNIFGMGSDKSRMRELLLQRTIVAYDLAAAFWYMHEKKLVYRDIKQENVGFDIRGDVKVFDFGLCKGLSPALKNAKDICGGYNLTPRTGSVPYMAPEVAECKPYETKADVFSFSILLWELLSLKIAYQGYSRREFLDRVVRGRERLAVNRNWPPLTRLMIKEAWDNDPRKRPNMKRVAVLLRGDLNDMTADSKVRDRTQHLKERSAHSARMSRGLTSSIRKSINFKGA